MKLFVVTALDANENSTVFYHRVKGQVQKELSLLPLAKYKPITGKLVADNMLAVAIQDKEFVNDSKLDNVIVRIIDNKDMHRLVN
ncbi:hypothetical protein LMH66_20130 [Shewanella sp. 10N.7]|uniref:hypothetical protein n=1 Tax=Shewanella sp. 10N.7 TaxID=2885093 RepID=UPI001E301A0E|nr:hypothetical protein [Shewanella sp. 10N.7]MCC4834954.1 hypothetical protein [Shewanella sp. 10N.7]